MKLVKKNLYFYYGSGMLRRNIRHYAVFLLSGGICENIRRLKLC